MYTFDYQLLNTNIITIAKSEDNLLSRPHTLYESK